MSYSPEFLEKLKLPEQLRKLPYEKLNRRLSRLWAIYLGLKIGVQDIADRKKLGEYKELFDTGLVTEIPREDEFIGLKLTKDGIKIAKELDNFNSHFFPLKVYKNT